ncbi:MAG: acyltransferase family protein [Roseburia sp.]|nr:acyltransferase family protein [Roseburia sp.]
MKDKKEFIAVDVFKVICAVNIAAMHLMALADPCPDLIFWFNQVVARLGVPFFLVSSGFFLYDKLNDREKVLRYVQRLAQLYALYTLIHLTLMWESYSGTRIREKLLELVKDIFVRGSYVQFWYFLSLMIAVGMLYLLMEHFKIKEKSLVILAVILYLIGVMENAYGTALLEVPVAGSMIRFCREVFITNRNGIFFAFPFVLMGMLLKKYAEKIKKGPYFLLFLGGLALMTVEAYFIKGISGQEAFSMIATTPVAIAFLFLGACFVTVPDKCRGVGKFMRNLSMLIFGWHMYIHAEYGYIVYYWFDSHIYFLCIMAATIGISVAIFFLSRFKIFEWLKYLY